MHMQGRLSPVTTVAVVHYAFNAFFHWFIDDIIVDYTSNVNNKHVVYIFHREVDKV